MTDVRKRQEKPLDPTDPAVVAFNRQQRDTEQNAARLAEEQQRLKEIQESDARKIQEAKDKADAEAKAVTERELAEKAKLMLTPLTEAEQEEMKFLEAEASSGRSVARPSMLKLGEYRQRAANAKKVEK